MRACHVTRSCSPFHVRSLALCAPVRVTLLYVCPGSVRRENRANSATPQVIGIDRGDKNLEWQLSDGQLSFNAVVNDNEASGVSLHSVVRLLNWTIIRSLESEIECVLL